MKKIFSFTFLLSLLPFVVSAQSSGVLDTFSGTLTDIGGIVQTLITIVFVLVILYFFWNLTVFVTKSGDEAKLAAAKEQMITGIVIITLMASIWGIVSLVQSAVGIDGNNSAKTIDIPNIR